MARLATGERRYGDPIGPPATITREPGQSRKAAATAGTLCAGVWLVGLPPISKSLNLQGFISKKSRSVTAFSATEVVHMLSILLRPFYSRHHRR
jgi:hypothetical protein